MATNSTSFVENKSSSSLMQTVHPAMLEHPLPTIENSRTVKLNYDNYLVWRKQMLNLIIGKGFEDMINGSRPCPPQFVEGSNKDNPDFTRWHGHNELIMSWIYSTLSEGVASQIKGHETAYAVWTELEKLFSANLRERVVAEVGERIPESLNSINYLDWSGLVRSYLQEIMVWYVIEAPIEKTREKDNDIAFYVIYVACGFPTNLCIAGIKSARRAWETLALNCKHYEMGNQGVDVEGFLKAGQHGDWKEIDHFLDLYPNLAAARYPHSGSTVLHLAALAGKEDIVKKMVGLMKEEDLEIRGIDGYTALANASAIGNIIIAKCMVEKHKILLSIPTATGSELLPVVIAVKYGHKQTAMYLYSITPQEFLSPDGRGKINGATLLTYSIRRQYYGITFGLIHSYPHLVVAFDHYGQSPLYQLACTPSAFLNASQVKFWQRWIYNFVSIQEIDYSSNNVILNMQDVEDSPGIRQRIVSSLLAVLGIKEVNEMKVLHLQSLGLVRLICQHMKTLGRNPNMAKVILDSLHEATARGIEEFIFGVLKVFPECIWLRDEDEATIFMKAVKFREAKVFSLIHGFTSKERIAAAVDSYGHNILHKAALLDEYTQDKISRIQGAALQMQSELQWFEEIKKITSSDRLDLKDVYGKTARQLFTESHEKLMRKAEKWMKVTSNSCIIVGVLVVTIMFAAAFTVPGGNQQNTGFPIFLEKKLFKIFIISDAVALFSSTTSVLMFMGILTSRYAEEDFLKSLPSKMIIGLSTLFISLATMMIAFTATLLIMLRTESWIIIPIVFLASLPVTLYVRLLYPLLYELLMSTYGPSIFDRNSKWSLVG